MEKRGYTLGDYLKTTALWIKYSLLLTGESGKTDSFEYILEQEIYGPRIKEEAQNKRKIALSQLECSTNTALFLQHNNP